LYCTKMRCSIDHGKAALNKSSCLVAALGLCNFIRIIVMNLISLYCAS
jgi:hypothetical protein